MPNPPQVFTAKLSDKTVHNPKFTEYHFELVQPNRMTFEAGQYVSLAVDPAGHRRSYSICSTPDEDHSISLFIDHDPNGMGVQYLENLNFGDTVSMIAPMGQFTVQSTDPSVPLAFVASGSGIAPLRSMLYDQMQKYGTARKMILYWGIRYEANMCWVEDLKDIVASYPNVTFHPTVSRPMAEWPLCRGRVTDCLTVHEIDLNAEYYVCGNQPMILDTIAVLVKRGVPENKIFHEKFY